MIWEYIECLFSPVACQLNDLLNHSYSIYFIDYLSIVLSSDKASWLSTLIELKIIQVHEIKY